MINNTVVGCSRDGHSEILCEGCACVNTKKCPIEQPLKVENNFEGLPPSMKKNLLASMTRNQEAFDTLRDISKYEKAALEIGKLVAIKQKQYGNSFGNADQIMKVLYPRGISTEQMKDALVVVRIIDKLFRISHGNLGSEDAFSDIVGYGLLAVVRNKQ